MSRTPFMTIILVLMVGTCSFATDGERGSPDLEGQREALKVFQSVVPRPYVVHLDSEDTVTTPAQMMKYRKWASGNIDWDGNPLPDKEVFFNRTAADVPPAVLERVKVFFEHVQEKRWSAAAGHVSRLSEALPFNPALSGDGRETRDEDRARLARITDVPGDIFRWPVKGKGRDVYGKRVRGWTVTVPRICEESGWLISYLEYDKYESDSTAIYWIREEGKWRVLCNENYLRYLDYRPGHEIDSELGENVIEFETAYARGMSGSGFWGRNHADFKKAFALCSKRYRKVRGYKSLIQDFDSGPEFNIPDTVCSSKFIRIAGFQVEGDEVRVITESQGRVLHLSQVGNGQSVWIVEDGQWRRDRY